MKVSPLPRRPRGRDAGELDDKPLPAAAEGLDHLGDFAGAIRRAGHAFGIQSAGAGLAYALQVLLARLLGASEFGIYSYTTVWAGIASRVANLGLPEASVRFVPEYLAKRDLERLHGFVRGARLLTAGVVGLCLAAAGALALAGSDSAALILGVALAPALAASTLESQLARAVGRVGVALVLPLVVRPLLIGCGVVVLLTVGPAIGAGLALAVTVGATYGMVALQHAFGRRLFDPAVKRARARSEFRAWLAVALPMLAAGAFTVTLLQVDIVIVGALNGAHDAGIYAAASKTASLVAFVLMAVNTAAAPQFSSLFALGRREELQRLVARLAQWIFWPSLALALGIAALSGPLMSLFGPGFEAARWPLLVLLLGQLVNAGTGSVGYLLTTTGYHREATRVLGWSALAGISFAVLGTLALGPLGAAIGSVAGFALWNGWLYRQVIRKVEVRPSIVDALVRPSGDPPEDAEREGGRR